MAAISSTLPEPMSVAGSGRGRRWRTSATTWPPALKTNSRNSARDSSESRPRELGTDARGAEEICKRSEGGDRFVCGAELVWYAEPAKGSAAKRSPGVSRATGFALRGERRPKSTEIRTARSGTLPRRPRSADEGCELPAALPELDALRASREAKSGAKRGAPALMLLRGRLRDRLHRCRNRRRTDARRYCGRTVLAVHDAAIAYHG
jgi:hypothetical protein